jgi:hypothetical protein
MLLLTLVLGRQHITAVANAPYLDPSPVLQRTWSQQQQQQQQQQSSPYNNGTTISPRKQPLGSLQWSVRSAPVASERILSAPDRSHEVV